MSQIGSSPLPPPFRGLHSPEVRKQCQIIFACSFRKSSIVTATSLHWLHVDSGTHFKLACFSLVESKESTPVEAEEIKIKMDDGVDSSLDPEGIELFVDL